MKKILITGGTGFIGKNLCEQLKNKYQIFAPGHTELDLIEDNVLTEYVNKHKIDVIIHGAIHVPMFNGEQNELFNDMRMFMSVEKASYEVEKVIYFGSGAEYDKRYHIRDVSEDDFGKSIPDTEYGIAKYTMTRIARTSNNIYNIRLFGIFGKYELWYYKFLSSLCCRAIVGLPLSIRKNCRFNFISIEDMPKVIDWVINEMPQYHDYNFCHDDNYLLSELAEFIREISQKELEIEMISSELALDYTASNKRLHSEIPDWKPTKMKIALEKLYRYYEEHNEIIDIDMLKAYK